MTTDNNGTAIFGGLADGTYYLEEIKAPAGYNQLTDPVEVKVEGGTAEANLTVTAKVENSAARSCLPPAAWAPPSSTSSALSW